MELLNGSYNSSENFWKCILLLIGHMSIPIKKFKWFLYFKCYHFYHTDGWRYLRMYLWRYFELNQIKLKMGVVQVNAQWVHSHFTCITVFIWLLVQLFHTLYTYFLSVCVCEHVCMHVNTISNKDNWAGYAEQ